MTYHEPVLLHECIEALKIQENGVYVDVTFGGGGHSREILKHLGPDGKLYAFDQDPRAIENKPDDGRIILIRQNFRFMKNFLKMHGAVQVDGILADLGISSYQIDTPERGFSTRFDAGLDMRMDTSQGETAADILNKYSWEELARTFREYGEVQDAAKLATRIIKAREIKPFETTAELKAAAEPGAKWGQENKYFAQVFQALRIELNKEMDVLKDLLIQSTQILKPGGRLVVMSYHSLEDRLVKNWIRQGKFEGQAEKDLFGRTALPLKDLTRKPVTASQEELERNPRSRSAKLRIAEKI